MSWCTLENVIHMNHVLQLILYTIVQNSEQNTQTRSMSLNPG